jgi:hypothetical protein
MGDSTRCLKRLRSSDQRSVSRLGRVTCAERGA